MLFNSLQFALFLPIVFAIFWSLQKKSLNHQNLLLLTASYFFYACWDWRFLFLLMFSTALDYFTGIKMHDARTENGRKVWFWLSIVINLGFLGTFKYFNFFAESFAELLSSVGFNANLPSLNIILPVGISFYTFHGISYVVDVYKRRIEPERNPVTYSLFVSYFPLLVAGPIERATHLLPQLKEKRQFSDSKAMDGVYQILWGLFKKVVIADTCARYCNDIFGFYEKLDSVTLMMGAIYFAFQIYGAFSGYSDIALGTSKLVGVDLLRNFNYPYFSRDIAEFWRRWHISLSTWFRDYLYIPLGGSKGSTWIKIRNTFIIFLVSGFWHGANWTFIAWGAVNALYFLPLMISNRNRNHMGIVAEGRTFPTFGEVGAMLLTFFLTCLAWVFFRSPSVAFAFDYLERIFTTFPGEVTRYLPINRHNLELLPLLSIFILIEWNIRQQEHPMHGKNAFLKAAVLILAILLFGSFSEVSQFIYFQF